MNSHTAPHGFNLHLHFPHTARRPAIRSLIPARSAPQANWLERLAAWAEQQPAHHRVGSWERFR